MRLRLARPRAAAVLALAVAGSVALTAAPATADQTNNERLGTKLARDVTVDGVSRHLAALQRIADQNGGTRASGLPGYTASSAYVHDKLAAAGWNVGYQDFDFPFFQQVGPTQLSRISPSPRTFTPETDVVTFSFSGSGVVTGAVRAVDPVIPPTPTPSSTSGCEPADFAGFPAGNIALIQRGTCTFAVKVANAVGGRRDRGDPLQRGPAGPDRGVRRRPRRPRAGLGGGHQLRRRRRVRAAGRERPGDRAGRHSTLSDIRSTRNVIAETKAGRADNVVFAGAHLDSVPEGPGINDNGTGAATLVELGLQLAKGEKPKNKVRLAFWGAEERNLLGSEFYVGELTVEQQKDIALYLNFDMIGSPNWGEFVYDGDDSDGVGAGPGPFGSAQIEALLSGYVSDRKQVPTEGTDFDGRSDYGPFIAVGIPSGGIFTGAEVAKTAAQSAKWGGTAGLAFDPCYHQACDTLDNVNRSILDKNADAVAFAVGRYALDTGDINGVGATGASASAAAAKAMAARVAAARTATPPAGQAA